MNRPRIEVANIKLETPGEQRLAENVLTQTQDKRLRNKTIIRITHDQAGELYTGDHKESKPDAVKTLQTFVENIH